MGLRVRTLLTVGLVVSSLLVALYAWAAVGLTAQYRDIEAADALESANRIDTALSEAARQLERTVSDWAPRDDAHRYMAGANPDYPRANMGEQALSNLEVSVMVFLDDDGRVVRAEFVDLELQTAAPADEAVVSAIREERGLRNTVDPRWRTSGVIATPRGPLLVAAGSVTSSDLYSPPNGTLVVGRFLDRLEVERLAGTTGMALSLFEPGMRTPPADVVDAIAAVGPSRDTYAAPLSVDSMGTYLVVRDLAGHPIAVLRSKVPRTLHAQGQSALGYIALSLAFLGVAATLSVYSIIDRSVLARVRLLAAEFSEIAESGSTSARVTVGGRDELATLATEVNRALAAIEDYEHRLVRARDSLEVRVRERTNELRESEERYRLLVERMVDAVFSVDDDGVIAFANPTAAELTGVPSDRLAGSSFTTLFTRDSRDAVQRRLGLSTSGESAWILDASIAVPGADAGVPVELRGVRIRDDAGVPHGTLWIAHDVAERRRFEAELLHMASHDHLTGLYNRRYFETVLETELASARASGGSGAVLWFDVDDFKDVNDSLGHRAGDEVLLVLAEQIRKQVRETNVLARLGGDEFAVLLPRTGIEEAQSAAARIMSAVNSHTYSVDRHAVRVSLSMGVVMYPEHGATVEELLANADVAMYRAKGLGRSRMVVHHDDGARDLMEVRQSWNERIASALRANRFVVHAQPILDVASDTIASHELLIRMVDEEDGALVMPAEFLPAAERFGLINDVDRWMVSRAIEALAAAPDEVRLDVNLSGRAFVDAGLLPWVASALKAAGVDPSRLGFEITETAAIADILRAQEFVLTLSDVGCRFSLDDFGSGFSSFYYLKHLPLDCLKVDGSFIRSLPHSEQDRHLVRGMVEMCRGLGIAVAAEYVEDEATLLAVRELGIDFAQGFHIGRPRPLADAMADTAVRQGAL